MNYLEFLESDLGRVSLLEKIIVVRHFDYKSPEVGEGILADVVLKRAKKLSIRIKKMLKDYRKILVLTSLNISTIHTGIIIASSLDCGIETDKCTYDDFEETLHYFNYMKSETEVIVVVGHQNLVSGLPSYLTNGTAESYWLMMGEGYVYDCTNQEIKLLQ